MGRKFLLNGPYKDIIVDNPEAPTKLAHKLLSIPNAKVLVADDHGILAGVIAIYIYEHFYSGEMTADELIWYVEPTYRGQVSLELLWAAERKAQEMGAIRMHLTAPTEEVGQIYKYCKYRQIEVGYQALLRDRVKPCQPSQLV
jgi:hypothetical protein